MIGQFKFKNVGQGCFYVGVIPYDGDDEFVIVYDCGSITDKQSYLDIAIADFHEKYDYIDL